MKIAIIDDDIIFCSELEKILYSILKKEIVSIDIFYDGKDFIDNWKSQNPYDIVFLDIEMKIYDGYTTGELIRKNDPYENIYIVYISCHTDYLSDYFKLHPFDFIEKPLNKSEIIRLTSGIIKDINIKKQRILITCNGNQINIPVSEIVFMETNKRTVNIHMINGVTLITYKKIEEILSLLNSVTNTFYRIHQSYAVNWQYVNRITASKVFIDNISLPISKNYKENLTKSQINSLTKD